MLRTFHAHQCRLCNYLIRYQLKSCTEIIKWCFIEEHFILQNSTNDFTQHCYHRGNTPIRAICLLLQNGLQFPRFLCNEHYLDLGTRKRRWRWSGEHGEWVSNSRPNSCNFAIVLLGLMHGTLSWWKSPLITLKLDPFLWFHFRSSKDIVLY